jgi:uncharacterized protein
MTQAPRSAPSRHRWLPLPLLAAVSFWVFASVRYQLVSSRGSDLIFIGAGALALSVLWQSSANRLELTSRGGSRGYLTWPFVARTLTCGLLLAALLPIVNAVLDTSPPRDFATILRSRSCHRWSCQLTLVGAPQLPVRADSMTITEDYSLFAHRPQEGDTVLLVVKPGYLGRSWISSSLFHSVDRSRVPCVLLSRAAARGDTADVLRFLAQGVSIDANDPVFECDTPLMSAAGAVQLPTVDFLLRHGADPNRANQNGETPLMRAVTAHSLPIVRLLLTHRANPEAASAGAHSVMGIALDSGDSSIVKAISAAIPSKPHLGSGRQ